MNPLYAARYAELGQDALAELASAHVTSSQERTRLFTQRLHEKVLDQIAREAGVQFIATLRDDDLPGIPGLPSTHTSA